MENIEKLEVPKLSEAEILERAYKQKFREIKIARTRASVLRLQIARAYEIIENIRFDFLSDTMFRDYISRAKKALEGAMSDYLLSDFYWDERIKKHREMNSTEYDKMISEPTAIADQGQGK